MFPLLPQLSYHLWQPLSFFRNFLNVILLYTVYTHCRGVLKVCFKAMFQILRHSQTISGNSRCLCDHITILSSVACSTSLCYQDVQEVSMCVNLSHISLTTSSTRQILCRSPRPPSGLLYLDRILHFSQA